MCSYRVNFQFTTRSLVDIFCDKRELRINFDSNKYGMYDDVKI